MVVLVGAIRGYQVARSKVSVEEQLFNFPILSSVFAVLRPIDLAYDVPRREGANIKAV